MYNVKSIIAILLIVLCAPEFLIAENLSPEQDPLLDWKRFINYELFAFDTEKNNYSDKIDIHRLPKLQELWKQAKTNYKIFYKLPDVHNSLCFLF